MPTISGAIEPLAILLRSSPAVKGIAVGPLTELSLYADDARNVCILDSCHGN